MIGMLEVGVYGGGGGDDASCSKADSSSKRFDELMTKYPICRDLVVQSMCAMINLGCLSTSEEAPASD